MARTIHFYRPQRTRAEDLEAILCGREPVLQEILERLGDWNPGSSRQHYLIIGPRGIGKTNLLTLVEHRIRITPNLSEKWHPVFIAEDSYAISRISDLLIEAVRLFAEQTGNRAAQSVYDAVRFDDNHQRVVDLTLDVFRTVHRSQHSGVVLMVENLNRLVERQIKNRSEIHLLRKILIEEDWITAIFTSPTYLDAVTRPEEPLFEFFRTVRLSELTPDEQQELLRKKADLDRNAAFMEYLRKFRSRLRALYHFTGGNPRLTMMLYDLVANQNVTEVTNELDSLLDQITPFYQERMKDISNQEGKLIETMALMPEGCTPTELAEEARLEPKLVRALLTRLEQAGYVRREERRQKQTPYIIPERFFRIWHQMNHSRAMRGRVQYLLEFFASWYATKEERDRVWNDLTEQFESGLREEDFDRVEDLAEFMKYVADVSAGSEKFEREFGRLKHLAGVSDVRRINQELDALDIIYESDATYLNYKGRFFAELGMDKVAAEVFQAASELDRDSIVARFNEAVALDNVGNSVEASHKYKETARLLVGEEVRNDAQLEQEELVRILQTESSRTTVRIAAYLIGRTGDATSCGDIIRILQTSAESWRRRHCATALGLLQAEEAVAVLIECLGDGADDVRGSAATALGRIGSQEAVAALIACLRDEDPTNRGSAATALGRIGSQEAVAALIDRLRDGAGNVRGSAATALGRIRSKEAVAALIACLHDEANDVRWSAATALGLIGSAEAVSPLIDRLKDEADNVRGSAATALGRIGSEKAVAALIDCLHDEADNVRGSAATALGRIGSEKAVATLIACLHDEANNVRGSAATALGRIGSEEAVAALIDCLPDRAYDVRGSAASALGRIGSEKAVAALIECLQDEANDVRGSAATALGRIGSEEAVAPLIDCLRDEASNVRASAATALGRIGSEEAVFNMPEMPSLVAGLMDELSEEKAVNMAHNLLRSAFRTGNQDVVRNVLDIITTRLGPNDMPWVPYQAALEYLESDRDPAVLHRQHLEMREAVQLLVRHFEDTQRSNDRGRADPSWRQSVA